MSRLLPRATYEAPPGYVAFVAQHLDSLRRDTGYAVDERRDPDHICTLVLTDVAVRWPWLELLRTRLRMRGAGDTYLRGALQRRSRREWDEPEARPVPVVVWRADERPPPAARTSVALRIAPHLRPAARTEAAPVAEAGIAWVHAHEVRRRRKLIVALIALVMLFALLARTHGGLAEADARTSPGEPAVSRALV